MSQTTDFTSFVTEHPNYFPGQYLLEEDFELQHKYLSDRQRYRNRSLHVSGIIEGLEVEIVTGKQEVKILSGSAIDSQGNLIVLKEDEPFIEFNGIANGELYIKYEEEKQNLQQTTKDTETRIVEKAVIEFAAKTPDGSVKLANLQISAGSVSFDTNNDRQYSGISLPNSNSKTLTLRSGGNGNPNLAVLTGSLEIDGDLAVDGTGTSSFAGSLEIDRTLTVKDISTNENQQNEESTIDIDGKQIVFTTDDISDNLKLQLSEGYGLGINYFTLFYTAGIHSWRDDQNNERMLLNTAPGAGLTVKGTGTSSFAGSLNIDGGLTVKGTGDSSFAGSLNIDGELTVEGTGTSSFKGSLNIDKTLTVKDSLTIQKSRESKSKIDIDDKQIVFTSDDISDYLRLQLSEGHGLGINNNTLFYTAGGKHSWRDHENIQRMLLTTTSDGGLTVEGTGTSSFKGNLTVSGAITPSAGDTENNGIMFPKDPFGASGDAAWIRYYQRSGEDTTFEIGTLNDKNDHIALMPGEGGVGIGTNNPTEKLEVRGGKTKLEQENWRTPHNRRNNWENFGDEFNTAGYFKDSLGIVHLRGLVKNGTANSVIFTLMDDCRPWRRELHAVQTNNNTIGRVDILANGDVTVVNGNSGWISLDGITFRAVPISENP